MVRIPSGDFDLNIVEFVHVLNSLPAIITTCSCGGHANQAPGQPEEGTWDIWFQVTQNKRDWLDLECLVSD
jgi:hypothetical protein